MCCTALHESVRPVRIQHVLPCYLINGTMFENNIEYRRCSLVLSAAFVWHDKWKKPIVFVFPAFCEFAWKVRKKLILFFYQYDQFSQVVSLKKAVILRIFFCFNTASDSSHKDLQTTVIYLLHKFAIKALLWNTVSFCTADSDISLKDAHRIHYCFDTETVVKRKRPNVKIHHFESLVIWNTRRGSGLFESAFRHIQRCLKEMKDNTVIVKVKFC